MKSARIPTSEPAKRISAIFHRQPTTKWSLKEIGTFRALVKDGSLTDSALTLIERCYRMQWPPNRNKNILRHDLSTFLNNWTTELDRAVAWNELHPMKAPPRKIIPMPPVQREPYVAATDPESMAQLARFEAARLARKEAK